MVTFKPSKRRGQNFLVDANINAKIARLTRQLNPHARCDEIGAGYGNLTAALLAEKLHVTAIENDTRLIPLLAQRFSATDLHIVPHDIRTWQPPLTAGTERICVGNIPYNLTTAILMWLKNNRRRYQHILLTIQKEVGLRLVAKPTTKTYGRITACMQLCFNVRKQFDIPRSCFRPRPRVDSMLVMLTPKPSPCHSSAQERAFERFTHMLFHMRRKTLATTLRRHGIACEVLTAAEQQARAETLSPQRIWTLLEMLTRCPQNRALLFDSLTQ